MSERLRTEGSRAPDPAPDADRDAKIEQLLLVGLDHYFAAQYDQAINVWTRVLFLDRSHARARAYIERARSALAERQRESEELLQSGVAAFRRGDSDEARRLLHAAMDGGAPPDEALTVLNQLNRLESAPAPRAPARTRRIRRGVGHRSGRTPAPVSGVAVSLTFLLAIVIAGVSAATAWGPLDWRSLLALSATPLGTSKPPIARESNLPLPTRSEGSLTRARALLAAGHLQDALTALDAVRASDAQRADADRLRGDIQRQLVALGALTNGKSGSTTP